MRQAIVTKYRGPTDTRGSRGIASAQAGRVIVAWDHALDVEANHRKAARALAARFGWKGRLVGGGLPNGTGNAFVFVD